MKLKEIKDITPADITRAEQAIVHSPAGVHQNTLEEIALGKLIEQHDSALPMFIGFAAKINPHSVFAFGMRFYKAIVEAQEAVEREAKLH